MDYAYKVPDDVRKQILAREKEFEEEVPFEDEESLLPHAIQRAYEEWANAGGPDDEDDEDDHHLFDNLPELIQRLFNGEELEDLAQDPHMNRIIFTVTDNPKRKESGLGSLVGDIGGGIANLATNPYVDAGAAGLAGLGLMATGVGAPEGAMLEGAAATDLGASLPTLGGEAMTSALGSQIPPDVATATENATGGASMANSIRNTLGGAWNKLPRGIQQGAQLGAGMSLGQDVMNTGANALGMGANGQQAQSQGLPGYISPQSSYRSEVEDEAGTLHYAAKDLRMEQLREQVRASLESWANSSNDPNNPDALPEWQFAIWWALYNAATKADDIATLSGILAAVPEKYHTQGVPQIQVPGGPGEPPTTQTGMPPAPHPNEMNEAKEMQPVTINPGGSQPEQPGQSEGNLIPGALSSVQVPDYLQFPGVEWKTAAGLYGGNPANPAQSGILQASPYVTGPAPQSRQQMMPMLPRAENDPTELNQDPAIQQPRETVPSSPSLPGANITNPSGPVQPAGAQPPGVTNQTVGNIPNPALTTPTQSPVSPNTVMPNAMAQQNVGPSNLPSARSASSSEDGVELPIHDEILPEEALRAEIQDKDGNAIHVGSIYEFSSAEFNVPELVRVASIEEKGVMVETLDTKIKFFVTDEIKPKFLSKEASISHREQDQLINEMGVARNLDRVVIDNSHYENEYPSFYEKLREVSNTNQPLSNLTLFDDDSLFL